MVCDIWKVDWFLRFRNTKKSINELLYDFSAIQMTQPFLSGKKIRTTCTITVRSFNIATNSMKNVLAISRDVRLWACSDTVQSFICLVIPLCSRNGVWQISLPLTRSMTLKKLFKLRVLQPKDTDQESSGTND